MDIRWLQAQVMIVIDLCLIVVSDGRWHLNKCSLRLTGVVATDCQDSNFV